MLEGVPGGCALGLGADRRQTLAYASEVRSEKADPQFDLLQARWGGAGLPDPVLREGPRTGAYISH